MALAFSGLIGLSYTLSHSPSSQADVAMSIRSRSASSFVDMLCVNTHFSASESPYVKRYGELRQKLIELGFRHIRDGYTGAAIERLKDLATDEIYTTYITSAAAGTKPTSDYWSYPDYLLVDYLTHQIGANVVDAVEMPNEIDNFYSNTRWLAQDQQTLQNDRSSPRYWGKYIKAYTQDSWRALKRNPSTARYPVYAPSFVAATAYSEVGDLSRVSDASNIHYYFAGRHPGTNGWGDNGYGSLSWQLQYKAKVQSRSKPSVITEMGYSNATAQDITNVSEIISSKYIPRALFRSFNAKFLRVCLYELVNSFDDSQQLNYEANFGLLRYDLSEKPAFTALKNLVALLKDSSQPFTPQSLSFKLDGETADIQYTLLQKQDRSFYLAIWIERASYDPTTGTATPVANQVVTLTVPQNIQAQALYTLDEQGNLDAHPVSQTNTAISLTVSDRVSLVQLSRR
jgi:hypothetical protein